MTLSILWVVLGGQAKVLTLKKIVLLVRVILPAVMRQQWGNLRPKHSGLNGNQTHDHDRRGHGFDSHSSLDFFFGLLLSTVEYITAMVFHLLKKHICSTNIWVSYIHLCFLYWGVYYKLTRDQLPVGLIAQLVRALLWYRKGHGFDSCSGLIFFFFFFRLAFLNYLSWEHYCNGLSFA